jgi:hypothetical protein
MCSRHRLLVLKVSSALFLGALQMWHKQAETFVDYRIGALQQQNPVLVSLLDRHGTMHVAHAHPEHLI